MARGRIVLVAAGAALLWAPPLAMARGGPPATAAALPRGSDLLTAVLAIGLAVVVTVGVVVGLLLLRAARRREDAAGGAADALEIAGHRARTRAHLRITEDPIVASMALDSQRRRAGRKP
jgi:hypothetical protein